jgi:hypothetical protein
MIQSYSLNKFYKIIIFILTFIGIFIYFNLILNSCVSSSINANKVRVSSEYNALSAEEKSLIESIMFKADSSDRRDYYYNRLQKLISTPTVSDKVIATKSKKRIDESVKEATKKITAVKSVYHYMYKEEIYENMQVRRWKEHKTGWGEPVFYVANSNPLDILVHIRVKLFAPLSTTKKILSLEDAVEKHLSREGFSVNLVFVAISDKDVFNVTVDPSIWANSHNWSGGYKTISHELLHLMGLDDEYDMIEMHYKNNELSMERRLQIFLYHMGRELPKDSANGIMCYSRLKPLQRHICSAVGLEEECVKIRTQAFGE